MKNYLLFFVLIACFVLFILLKAGNNTPMISDVMSDKELQKEKEEKNLLNRLSLKADSAKAFCKKNNYNMDYCFLVDFSIHSGKKRFFVWDFNANSIKYSGLCCHGYGKKSTGENPVFSNEDGSYCSSLGKYKVGVRSYSSWGINVHYKMHGLEKTNNNAFKRIIVLHSHSPIPDDEIYPMHLPLGYSQGCPVISNELMRNIDSLQKKIKEPVLLWIYK